MQKQVQLLPNLNSVRAIAAIMVVVCHVELRKPDGLRQIKPLLAFGNIGVSIFFVLSGFLITYLLLKEKEVGSGINIKHFYMRRILRIWRLYFLILFLGYFFLPWVMHSDDQPSPRHILLAGVILNTLFLTNITLVLKLTPLIISIIWSIGIEEQFYIFWPWVAKKSTAKAVTLVIAISVAIPVLKMAVMGILLLHDQNILKIISRIISTSRFDLMAVGGFCAFVGYYKTLRIGRLTIQQAFIQQKSIQLISLAGFIICVVIVCAGFFVEVIPWFLGIFTAVLLSNLALNKNVIISLENRIAGYLGKISYGIYLWHMPVIYCINRYLYPFFSNKQVFIKIALLHACGILFAVGIASLSYYFFEKPFLNLKNRFVHNGSQN